MDALVQASIHLSLYAHLFSIVFGCVWQRSSSSHQKRSCWQSHSWHFELSSRFNLCARIQSILGESFWFGVQSYCFLLLALQCFPSSQDASFGLREAKFGTIKIRLRLEMENERTLLLSNLCVPLSVYVNQDTKKDFEVLRQTVEGRVDSQQFSLVSMCNATHSDTWWIIWQSIQFFHLSQGTINAHCGECKNLFVDYSSVFQL